MDVGALVYLEGARSSTGRTLACHHERCARRLLHFERVQARAVPMFKTTRKHVVAVTTAFGAHCALFVRVLQVVGYALAA